MRFSPETYRVETSIIKDGKSVWERLSALSNIFQSTTSVNQYTDYDNATVWLYAWTTEPESWLIPVSLQKFAYKYSITISGDLPNDNALWNNDSRYSMTVTLPDELSGTKFESAQSLKNLKWLFVEMKDALESKDVYAPKGFDVSIETPFWENGRLMTVKFIPYAFEWK